ncbi:MAG: hypothetical protein KDB80_10315 [Planctomycetes bacterium]|nr:hypothetical protein [Planctomycetota bacterium]
MTRPSHWILISLAAFATVVSATGSWRRVFTSPKVDHWVNQRGTHARRAVELGRPVELFGAVFDRVGKPLAGAEVRTLAGDARGRTDADGRFAISVTGRCSHELVVESEGPFTPAAGVAVPGQPLFVVLEDAAPWHVPPATTPERSLLVGEGYLKDDAGDAVAFGQVAVRETGTTVIADQFGRFRIPLPTAGEVTLVASDADGRVARSAPFKASRRSGLVPVDDLVVGPGATVAGLVRDESGQLVDGAIVVAADGEVRRIAVTGRSGKFFLDGLCQEHEYALTVLPHHGKLGSALSIVAHGHIDRDLFLSQADDRRFHVVRADGTGVADAHVVVSYSGSAAYGRADGDGWVSIPDVVPADLASDAMGIVFDVRDAETTPLEVVSVADGTITVKG